MAPTYAGMSGRKLSLTVSTIATMGFLLFGYDQGVMSGIISATAFNDVFTATKNDNTMQALVTAVYELGCLFGAVWALFMGDRMGRRWMIISGASIMIIGVIIQVTAFVGHVPLAQFIIGRIVTGVGNGMNTSTIPTYQAECSRTSNRGLLICIEGGIIAIGTAIAYWIDFGASYGPDDLVWRFPIAFQIVFGIIIIVGMAFLPDSPRYLISKGKVHEGEYVLLPSVVMRSTPTRPSCRSSSLSSLLRLLVSRRVLDTRICLLVARLSTCAVCLSVLPPKLPSSCLVVTPSFTISPSCFNSLSVRVAPWP